MRLSRRPSYTTRRKSRRLCSWPSMAYSPEPDRPDFLLVAIKREAIKPLLFVGEARLCVALTFGWLISARPNYFRSKITPNNA